MIFRRLFGSQYFLGQCFLGLLIGFVPTVETSSKSILGQEFLEELPASSVSGNHAETFLNKDNKSDDVSLPEDNSPSNAEKIAELQKTLEEDRKQLTELEASFDSPQGEYALAEQAFRELNDDLDREKQALENVRNSGDSTATKRLELEIASIERKRELAEARFELAIEDRKTNREQAQNFLYLSGRPKNGRRNHP